MYELSGLTLFELAMRAVAPNMVEVENDIRYKIRTVVKLLAEYKAASSLCAWATWQPQYVETHQRL
jgi:hypothetical protein